MNFPWYMCKYCFIPFSNLSELMSHHREFHPHLIRASPPEEVKIEAPVQISEESVNTRSRNETEIKFPLNPCLMPACSNPYPSKWKEPSLQPEDCCLNQLVFQKNNCPNPIPNKSIHTPAPRKEKKKIKQQMKNKKLHDSAKGVDLHLPKRKAKSTRAESFEKSGLPGKLRRRSTDNFGCRYCGQKFDTMQKLQIHEINEGKLFEEPQSSNSHQMHTASTSASKSFSSNSRRNKNKRLPPQIDEAPYKCEECGKRFNLINSYKAHKRRHTLKLTFECHHCNKKFAERFNLTRHLLSHTKEKPFDCKVCGTKFTYKYNLVNHEEMHYSGESAPRSHRTLLKTGFKCQYCDFKHSRKKNVLKHERTHTD